MIHGVGEARPFLSQLSLGAAPDSFHLQKKVEKGGSFGSWQNVKKNIGPGKKKMVVKKLASRKHKLRMKANNIAGSSKWIASSVFKVPKN